MISPGLSYLFERNCKHLKLEFKIGYRTDQVEVAEENLMGILHARPFEESADEAELVRQALANPIGTPRLKDIVHPGEKIVIITSDITRPMPTARVMPVLLDELYSAGVDRHDIQLIFALGSHRGHTEEERRRLAGDRAYQEITCTDFDPSDLTRVGVTARGVPIDIDSRVVRADRRICLGNVEYHYFVGYSGGAKAIMPGVASRASIQANHSMMTREDAHAGKLQGNPVRAEIEEAASLVGVDFILNVVLDEHKRIAKAVAGDMILAHREGCRCLDEHYLCPIARPADIVLVSQGGAPKDLNVYQTQKALDNAGLAVRPGGVIVLIGSCHEGLGEKTFEQWMLNASGPDELIDRIQKDFQLGGHKAAAIAMVRKKADIYLVSDLEAGFVRRLFMEPFSTVQQAYDAALEKMGPNATVLAMPYGGSTLPVFEEADR